MSYWNYRLVQDEYGVAMHEVYYTDKGVPEGWTAEPIACHGENVEEAVLDFELMKKALEKPVLVVDGDKLIEKTN